MKRQSRQGKNENRGFDRDYNRENEQRGDWGNYEDQDMGGYTGLGSSRTSQEGERHFGRGYGMSHGGPTYGRGQGERYTGGQGWQGRQDWRSQDWTPGHGGYGTTSYGRGGYPEEGYGQSERGRDWYREGGTWGGPYERRGEGYGLSGPSYGQGYTGGYDRGYQGGWGGYQGRDMGPEYDSRGREDYGTYGRGQERTSWGRGYDRESEDLGREDWNLGNYGQRGESERSRYRYRRGGSNLNTQNYTW